MNNLIIAGCGYLGQRLAHYHQQQGDRVSALVRSAASCAALIQQGLACQRWDLDTEDAPVALDFSGRGLYWLVPPPAQGGSDERSRRMIELLDQDCPSRVVVISTTGVYGDCAGAWVDESWPVDPVAPRAQRRWSAEQQWRSWAERQQVPLVILRVPGIYGPGRLPLERLRKGLPMLRAEDAPWSNRIHVDDLVSVCVAAMQRGQPGALYNVSDGQPSTMLDYFNRVADRVGLPRPPQIDRSEAEQRLSAEMLSYLRESRRIDNSKMLRELQVSLRYPGLDQGLPACLAGESR